MRLKPEEASLINEYRERNHQALAEECKEKGISLDDVNYYWYKSEKFSINVKPDSVKVQELMSDFIEDVKKYSPKYPKIKYEKSKDGHLLVIDPADIHIGKLARAIETGDEYDHNIAFKRVKDAVINLLGRSSGYDIEKILLVAGNDILHVDNTNNTTTSGTPQDTSVMWYDAFKIAHKLLVECIEILVQVAPTHVIYNPSNHDKMSGFFLLQSIESWFHNCENVSFDVSPSHRKYFRYYNNLIGTCHGDGAKEQDLPLLMAHESKYWSECKHKYFYTHHIHHKKSKDYMGVTVESMRSPSGSDGWHSKAGLWYGYICRNI